MAQLDQIQLQIPLDPPLDGKDLCGHLAFRFGADLLAYSATRQRRTFVYMVGLGVPSGWSQSQHDALQGEIERALRLMRGMPWLGVREVLAYMAAEDAIKHVGDERASEMFALLRETHRSGWREILQPLMERVRPYAEHTAKQVVATKALAAMHALSEVAVSLYES